MIPNSKTFKLPICDTVFLYCSLLLFVVEITVALCAICKIWFSGSEVSAAVLLCNFIAVSLACNLLSLYLCLTDVGDTFQSQKITLAAIIFHVCQLGIFWRLVDLLRNNSTDANRVRVLICRFLVLQSAYGLFLGIFQAFTLSYIIMSKHLFQQPHILVLLLICNLAYACWSFAGFHRNLLRSASPERHFISWPGILSQWLWRLGTVGSRIIALAAYASMYRWYGLLFAGLHSVTILTFLVVLRLLDGRKPLKKNEISGIYTLFGVSAISVIDFVNHSSKAFKLRICVHYVIEIAENSLLFGIWYNDLNDRYVMENLWLRNFTITSVFGGFLFGLFNMILYFNCFHIRLVAKKFSNVGNNHITANGSERVGIVRCNFPLQPRPTSHPPNQPTVPVRKKKLPSQADPSLLQPVSGSPSLLQPVSASPSLLQPVSASSCANGTKLSSKTSNADSSADAPVGDSTTKKSNCSLQRTLSAPLGQILGNSPPSNNPYASETGLVLDAPKFKANGSEMADGNSFQQNGARSLPRKQRRLQTTLSSSYINTMFQQNESSGDSSSDIDLEIRRSCRPPRRRKALSGASGTSAPASQEKPRKHPSQRKAENRSQKSPHNSNEADVETAF